VKLKTIALLLGTFFLIFSCVPAKKTSSTNPNDPQISLSGASAFNVANNSLSYTVTYTGARSITLSASNVNLITTGTITGTISVSGTGLNTRTITVGSITGSGTIAISINAGTATDIRGSRAVAIGPTTPFSRIAPSISFSSPSATLTRSGPITYTLTYDLADAITLANANVTLNKTGTVAGSIAVSGAGLTTRTVVVSGITGDGSFGLNVAAGTATNGSGSPQVAVSSPLLCVVDNTAPGIGISAPSSSTTITSPITYTISYTSASSVTLTAADITLNKTGTADGVVAVSGTGTSTRTVTISGITGNGTLGISVAANTAVDTAGNSAAALGASTTFVVDDTAPTIAVSSPSQSLTTTTAVTYTITYAGASSISLTSANVTINATGTASATATVSGTGTTTRTVTLGSITGDGTLGISIAAGTASDSAGNSAAASGASTVFTVDNTVPTLSVSAPSLSITKSTSVTYTLTYTGASTVSVAAGNITLSKTGTANGGVVVSGTGTTTRTVTIGSITGDGTIGITVASGTASDSAGNFVSGTSTGTDFTVDNTAPTVSLSAPSASSAVGGPITYTATYTGASAITLADADVTINKLGTATGSVAVTGSGTATRTITLSSLTGDGSLGISLAASTATDVAGNLTLANGPSTTFYVYNDPLFSESWHLKNIGQTAFSPAAGTSGIDLNLLSTWALGYLGQGINVLVSDTGVDSAHEDLSGNFLGGTVSKDFINGVTPDYLFATAEPNLILDATQAHGTAVAGLIAGVNSNAIGGSGVAPSAKLGSANLLNGSFGMDQLLAGIDGTFNVINQSWGYSQCSLSSIPAAYELKMKTDRKLYIKSAGNDYDLNLTSCGGANAWRHGNSNFDGWDATPYTIVVAALNSNGVRSSYSSPGSNLWITGFGGEFGSDYPAMVTTDISGCTYGQSPLDNYNSFQVSTHPLNTNCNYTSIMNGTSSAAPTISGVVALLLSANNTLTARDVKHILASTTTLVDLFSGNNTNSYVASPAGHVWQQGWVTNAANYNFHNTYGFGLANTAAAIAMATSAYVALPAEVESGYTSSGVIALAIPDNSATGVQSTINVAANLTIEGVQIKTSATHADIGQLGIELVSPGGTKSIIVNVNNALEGQIDYIGEVMLTNAFYGENSAGNWTIKLIDGRTGTTGTLTNWQINIIGH
jgi:subtilisin family serine protease